MDPNLRDSYRSEPWFPLAERFADEWDQTSFDPDYPTETLAHFEPRVRAVFAHPHTSDGAHPAAPVADPAGQPRRPAHGRARALRPRPGARPTSTARYPGVRFGPVVALIAAYEEEANIGAVLKAMPTLLGDLEVSTLVVVDGGTRRHRPGGPSTPGCSPACSRSTWARGRHCAWATSWPPPTAPATW